MLKAVRQEEMKRIDTMTIIEAVAYANQLCSRLN
jgi:tetrahydromethanopterin S-methyltransferase subunit F